MLGSNVDILAVGESFGFHFELKIVFVCSILAGKSNLKVGRDEIN